MIEQSNQQHTIELAKMVSKHNPQASSRLLGTIELESGLNGQELEAIADLYLKNNDKLAAIRVLYRAVRIRESAKIWARIGKIELQEKRLLQACQSFLRSLSIDPNLIEALLGRGVCLDKQRLHWDARVEYFRILKLRPGHIKAMNNIIISFTLSKQYKAALNFVEYWLKFAPYNKNLLGFKKQFTQKLKQAEHNKLLEVRPKKNWSAEDILNQLNAPK